MAGAPIRPTSKWLIAGGETGPHARPVHPDWLRRLRDQCAAANTPFFFKQWGGSQGKDCTLDGHTEAQTSEIYTKSVDRWKLALEAMRAFKGIEW